MSEIKGNVYPPHNACLDGLLQDLRIRHILFPSSYLYHNDESLSSRLMRDIYTGISSICKNWSVHHWILKGMYTYRWINAVPRRKTATTSTQQTQDKFSEWLTLCFIFILIILLIIFFILFIFNHRFIILQSEKVKWFWKLRQYSSSLISKEIQNSQEKLKPPKWIS